MLLTEMNVDQAIYNRDAAAERTRAFIYGSAQWIKAVMSEKFWADRVVALLGGEAVAA